MFDKLVDLIVSWIKLFFFTYVLHADQRGIVLRFGRHVRDVGPGWHFKWPFDIDEVFFREITPSTLTVGPQSLTTKDDRDVVVSVLVTYQIEDVRRTIIEIQGVLPVLHYATYGVVSDFVMKHTWAELRNVRATDDTRELDLDNEIAKAVRRRAKKYGVHIIDVQFCDLTKSRSLRLIGAPLEMHNA